MAIDRVAEYILSKGGDPSHLRTILAAYKSGWSLGQAFRFSPAMERAIKAAAGLGFASTAIPQDRQEEE